VRVRRAAVALAASLLFTRLAPASAAPAENSADALVAEMRRAFTVGGKPVPPEVFRDFGDGDLPMALPTWVTVDVVAAIDSDRYQDKITREGDWLGQQGKALAGAMGGELTSYRYIGSTGNGLLVVLASYSGGGSGVFFTLHILDVAAGRGFDPVGELYERINLTNLRSVSLGDRWSGEVSIAGNRVTLVTECVGPNNCGFHEKMTIEARRP
jgi:hypothetical protein